MIKLENFVEKEKYDHLLKIARKMHEWIFLNSYDEDEVYAELGLTFEDNVMLGYGGKIEITTTQDHLGSRIKKGD